MTLRIASMITPVITPEGERTTARAWADALGLQYAPAVLFFDERGQELLRLDSVVGFQRLGRVLDDIAGGDAVSEGR